MRTAKDIAALLPELEYHIADEFEDQDLDFKQWDTQSRDKSVQMVVRMAVCMANGGGGTVVFGVADQVKGQQKAVLGIPLEIDINILKKAVYDQTDPKIMPVFETMTVLEGTGRLLLMHIHPGLPPYTDTSGRGTVRIGKDCQPLTGTLRRKISVETGETDYTSEVINAKLEDIISPSAIEILRMMAKEQNAPQDLLKMKDRQLLDALGALPKGKVTRAAVLLCGKEEAIRSHIQGHHWIFLRMQSDTQYDVREDKVTAIPLSISRLEDMLLPFNPITTVEHGLYHFEYRAYPDIAFREALMNAFCHADYRIAGPILVKMFHNRLVVSNNGGFIAGITEQNILHHQPAARNPLLVEALTRLRLVNRSNLGIARMYSAFLIEGKRPPVIQEIGDSVAVTFLRSDMDASFRSMIAEIKDPPLDVDELLALSFLRQNPLSDVSQIAEYCNCSPRRSQEVLDALADRGLAESGDPNKHSLWQLSSTLRRRYPSIQVETNDRESILNLLRMNPTEGVSVGLIIDQCGMSRSSAKRLLGKLREEGLIQMIGKGAKVRWIIDDRK